MKLRNTRLFFLIDKNPQIRHEVFNYEEILKKAFKTPFIINNNVSDEADPNIVRFQAISLNSFSNLQVTQNKIILETNYDNNFETNLHLIEHYLYDKTSILKPVISKERLRFVGIVSLIDNEMDPAEILPLIKAETKFELIQNNIIELKYQYKKKYEDKYIVNIEINPYTRYIGQLVNQDIVKRAQVPLRVDSKGLQIKLDINNNVLGAGKREVGVEMIDEALGDFFRLLNRNELSNFIKGDIL